MWLGEVLRFRRSLLDVNLNEGDCTGLGKDNSLDTVLHPQSKNTTYHGC